MAGRWAGSFLLFCGKGFGSAYYSLAGRGLSVQRLCSQSFEPVVPENPDISKACPDRARGPGLCQRPLRFGALRPAGGFDNFYYSPVPYYSLPASGQGVPLERLISSTIRERFVKEPELLGPGLQALASLGSWEAKAML